jgi:KaiC/GvpD/RAD55 family RecA-like ATPase
MKSIESGISGLDELLATDESSDLDGIPMNSATLIYGPPKVGKSIFCNQFTYHGLENEEPCLYLAADAGMKDLQQNMIDFGWYLNKAQEKELIYVIDPISALSGAKIETSNTYQLSKINDQAAIMVKVGIGTRFIFKKSNKFRAVFDSLTTPFAFNPPPMVIRFLKTYVKRLKEAGATVIISYTEGTADEQIEKILKSIVDNLIELDGEKIIFRSSDGLVGHADYKITDRGIFLGKGEIL